MMLLVGWPEPPSPGGEAPVLVSWKQEPQPEPQYVGDTRPVPNKLRAPAAA